MRLEAITDAAVVVVVLVVVVSSAQFKEKVAL